MELAEILVPESVRTPHGITSKKRLLSFMAETAAELHGIKAQVVLDALSARESLGTTGMGNGVAVPHARIDDTSAVLGYFFRLEQTIDFTSVDGQPVDLVFGLLAPHDAGAQHLKALARVSRTLRDAEICRKLRSTIDPAALFAILTEPAASKAA